MVMTRSGHHLFVAARTGIIAAACLVEPHYADAIVYHRIDDDVTGLGDAFDDLVARHYWDLSVSLPQ